MKRIEIDVAGLSSHDLNRFLDFLRLHKNQCYVNVIETWNKFAKGIHQHVFYKEVEI